MAAEPAIVQCAYCRQRLSESPSVAEKDRSPCLRCGLRARHISEHIGDLVAIRTGITWKHRRPGRKRPLVEAEDGYELEYKSGQLMRKTRLIDREKNRYYEKVTDPRTGAVIRECEQALTDHRGHGSAKQGLQAKDPRAG